MTQQTLSRRSDGDDDAAVGETLVKVHQDYFCQAAKIEEQLSVEDRAAL